METRNDFVVRRKKNLNYLFYFETMEFIEMDGNYVLHMCEFQKLFSFFFFFFSFSFEVYIDLKKIDINCYIGSKYLLRHK